MFTVSREIDFCYGHRLLNYAGKCRHLHGHNGHAMILFEASALDAHGMVLDFSEIKRVVSHWIDENLDHRMILDRADPAVRALEDMGEPTYLMDVSPTAENIAKLIFEAASKQGFPVVEVRLWETPNCCAVYRPGDSSDRP
jgi:6-pyruvoyltetrahydropterin/6-carboxytetrahydropterin synthase